MLNSRTALYALSIIPIAMIFLAIVGGFNQYSPIPFGDMWDGTLDSYIDLTSGNLGELWSQHNEHRIVLARLLFVLDLGLFGGKQIFLYIINYALVFLSIYIFRQILIERIAPDFPKLWINFATLFLAGWLFFWSQENNLTWGFQSQFFLAQILPLSAFYFLHKSKDHPLKSKEFILACLFGVLSAGTMANGILALPLLVLGAVICGFDVKRISILAVLSIVTVGAYLHNYHSPVGHGSLFETLKDNPLGMLLFTSIYAGSPFGYGIMPVLSAVYVACFAGAALISLSALKVWHVFAERKTRTLEIALLLFILYVGCSAFITAGGRLSLFGKESALSSRYSTPSLMIWAALFCLYAPTVFSWFKMKKWVPQIGLGVIFAFGVWMLNLQMNALQSKAGIHRVWDLAGLALELGIDDEEYIKSIYPSSAAALHLAKKSSDHDISIFGLRAYKGLREQLGQKSSAIAVKGCAGAIDRFDQLPKDKGYVRIHGWLFDSDAGNPPKHLEILNASDQVIGFAFSGDNRPDLITAIDENAGQAGYQGYVASSALGQTLKIRERNTRKKEKIVCEVSGQLGDSYFKVIPEAPTPANTTVSLSSIIGTHTWTGADFAKSEINGMTVLGSFIASDADTGEIVLSLKQGDKIYYSSGPTSGNQTLDKLDDDAPPILLPVSANWVLLDFSTPNNGEAASQYRFSDNGSGWGEWSAIAIASNK